MTQKTEVMHTIRWYQAREGFFWFCIATYPVVWWLVGWGAENIIICMMTMIITRYLLSKPDYE